MTTPTNTVEKPATGCGCDPLGSGQECPEATRLWEKSEAAWRRVRRGKALGQEYRTAFDAYRAHVEAAR